MNLQKPFPERSRETAAARGEEKAKAFRALAEEKRI
jgi:hypothetical protein